jgi:GntR family transcriptional regulator
LTIGSADLATATFLEIEVDAPTAEVRRVITDVSGSVIYFAEITYRGDFVKFDIDLLSNRAGTKSTGV